MLLDRRILLACLTICLLLGLTYGIIGEKVRDVKPREFTFVVSISARPTLSDPNHIANLHICTGTLVSHKSVLTVAHCLLHRHPNQIEIIAGSTNLKKGQRYFPESWITFDEWNDNQRTKYPKNDIAVIILSGEGITNIQPAPILKVSHEYLTGTEVRILGWGKMENGKLPAALKTAKLKVISNEECSHQGTMVKGQNFTVPPNYFCTMAEPWVLSSCGDGGAPIVDKNHHLVGINVGTCPIVDGYPQDVLNQLQRNSHLNFHFYRDFLKHTIRE